MGWEAPPSPQSKLLLKLYLLVQLISSSLIPQCLLVSVFQRLSKPPLQATMRYAPSPIFGFCVPPSNSVRQMTATNIIKTVQHRIPNNKYTTKSTLFTAVKVHTWQVLDFSGRCTHFPPIARLFCRSAYSGRGSVTPNASFSQ